VLAYVLAMVVGLGSIALYMAAFFFPELHRKQDFIWSGIAMFYALVLWVCADRITGGVLLGQTASVALLGWFGWQTLTLRRQITPTAQQTTLPSTEEWKATLSRLASPETVSQAQGWLSRQGSSLKTRVEQLLSSIGKPTPTAIAEDEEEAYVPLTPADFVPARRETTATEPPITTVVAETMPADTGESETLEGDPWLTNSEAQPQALPLENTPSSKQLTTPTKKSGRAIANEPIQAVGLFATISGIFQDTLKGLTKKKEEKPVYVRKQYRTADVATESAENAESTTEAPVVEPSDAIAESLVSPGTEVTPPVVDTAVEAVEDWEEDWEEDFPTVEITTPVVDTAIEDWTEDRSTAEVTTPMIDTAEEVVEDWTEELPTEKPTDDANASENASHQQTEEVVESLDAAIAEQSEYSLGDLVDHASDEAGAVAIAPEETVPSADTASELEISSEDYSSSPEHLPGLASELTQHPEPIHPNPPPIELVEAALEDAVEKKVPASPPPAVDLDA